MNPVNSEKLRQDLRTVMVDTEELLKATASQTGDQVERVRARAEETLRGVRLRLSEVGQAIGDSAGQAAGRVGDTVRENPWTAMGVAAAVGVLIGTLLGRR